MSFENNMFHPPVGFDTGLQTDLRQKFTEDAFALLTKNYIQKITQDIDGEIIGSYRATDRLDIEQEDGTTTGVRLRFVDEPSRLQINAAVTALNTLNVCEDTGQVLMISLEYCDFYSQGDMPAESELAWQDYVLILLVAKIHEPIVVLDARSGNILHETDLLQASNVLYALRDYLHADLLLEHLVDQDAESDMPSTTDEFGYGDFAPGEFIAGNECPTCPSDYAVCNHAINKSSLN